MIHKAIISVAGWGTRRLPITKAIEKCMLPIGNRPIVDYVVQDCIKAGITDIYFVVSVGSTQLEKYYSDNDALNQYLIASGKNDALKQIAAPGGITFHYIEQPVGKYGTAIPVALVAPYLVDEESVVVLGGDDFIYNQDGTSEIKRLIDATPDHGNTMLGANVERELLGKYGVIEMNDAQDFIRIIEKPSPEDAPSTLINISKYVLNHDAVQTIVEYTATDQLGEYYITDPLNLYVATGGKVKIVQAKGQYLDGGNADGWLHANRVILNDA
jgi:UTP--glucose-1-phosphate uridylyltransferase